MTLFHRILRLFGLFALGGSGVLAALAPWLAPFSPDDTIRAMLAPGTLDDHGRVVWLGTDHLGRDGLSRFIYGLRSSLAWIFLTLAFTYGFALPLAWIAGAPSSLMAAPARGLVAFGRALPPLVVYLVLIAGIGFWPHLLFVAFALASLPNLADGCAVYREGRAEAGSSGFRRGELAAFLAVDALRRAAFFGAIIEAIAFAGLLGGYSWMDRNLGELVNEYRFLLLVMPTVALTPILLIGLVLLGLNALATSIEPLVPRALWGHDPARPSFRPGR